MFSTHTIDTLHAVLHEPVPSLLDETPSVPPQMSAFVKRLLEKEPGGRFQTASDLAWALEQPAYAPMNRTAPQPRSRHAATTWRWASLAAGIAIVGVVAGALWMLGPDRETPGPRPLAQFSWGLPSGIALGSAPDGRTVVYRSGAVDRSNITFAAADGTGISSVLACPGRLCEPTDWSADGRSLIVTVAGGDIWMVPIDPKESSRPLLDGSFIERDARLSPDGRWIA